MSDATPRIRIEAMPALAGRAEIRLLILARIKLIVDYNVHEGSALDAELKKLARALFPPMAKPLVWVGLEVAGLYKIGRYYEKWRALHWQYQLDDQKWALVFLLDQCSCEESAKAACESHHQARFLEQMA